MKMDYKCIVIGSLILALNDHLDWIFFGYQKDNKENGYKWIVVGFLMSFI